MATPLHEPAEKLSAAAIEMHRALVSLIEELEAVDWYTQRVHASGDEELKRVLSHSLDEEKEHASMTLEWIRRNDQAFDRALRAYLFSTAELGEEREVSGAPGGEKTLRIGGLRARKS
jgi:uncharacterized protein